MSSAITVAPLADRRWMAFDFEMALRTPVSKRMPSTPGAVSKMISAIARPSSKPSAMSLKIFTFAGGPGGGDAAVGVHRVRDHADRHAAAGDAELGARLGAAMGLVAL